MLNSSQLAMLLLLKSRQGSIRKGQRGREREGVKGDRGRERRAEKGKRKERER